MEYQIEITDTIGYWECSYYYIRNELNKCKKKPVNVKISSVGGDVWEALKIYQLFKDHGQVTAYLSGIVASAATFLSLGAAKVVINKNTLYMIHNSMSWVDNWGYMNKEEIQTAIKEMQKTAERNEKIDHLIASLYADRSGKDIQEFKDSMTKETWMLPEEVKAMGLADEISEEETLGVNAKMVARISAAGMPKLPDSVKINAEDEYHPGFIARIAAEVAKVVNPNPTVPIVNDDTFNQKNNIIMKKTFNAVMALLIVDALPSNNEKFEINETQMAAIDNALAGVASVKDDLQKAISAKDAAEKSLADVTAAKNAAEQKANDLQAKLDEMQKQVDALKSASPQAPQVQNQGGGDDNDAPLNEADAIKLAQSYMGCK